MRRLHELAPEQLAKLDIAEANLECALGLPGSEDLDIPSALQVIDNWAGRIREKTVAYWPKFLQAPEAYFHSEAFFRMLVFTTVLYRDCGVRYNTECMDGPFDCTDSRTQFIHGITEGVGGTCASMPVLYVAIGRRLGYPLKLVTAREHLFCRWDEPQRNVNMNVEATSAGLNTYPDDYYRSWPKPFTPEQEAIYHHLVSLTSQEELAEFYSHRTHCMTDWGHFLLAFELANHAMKLAPQICGHEIQQAIATVLYRHTSGLVDYRLRTQSDKSDDSFVVDRGKVRPLQMWERRIVPMARDEMQRIDSIHRKRGTPRKTLIAKQVFDKYDPQETFS